MHEIEAAQVARRQRQHVSHRMREGVAGLGDVIHARHLEAGAIIPNRGPASSAVEVQKPGPLPGHGRRPRSVALTSGPYLASHRRLTSV